MDLGHFHLLSTFKQCTGKAWCSCLYMIRPEGIIDSAVGNRYEYVLDTSYFFLFLAQQPFAMCWKTLIVPWDFWLLSIYFFIGSLCFLKFWYFVFYEACPEKRTLIFKGKRAEVSWKIAIIYFYWCVWGWKKRNSEVFSAGVYESSRCIQPTWFLTCCSLEKLLLIWLGRLG